MLYMYICLCRIVSISVCVYITVYNKNINFIFSSVKMSLEIALTGIYLLREKLDFFLYIPQAELLRCRTTNTEKVTHSSGTCQSANTASLQKKKLISLKRQQGER